MDFVGPACNAVRIGGRRSIPEEPEAKYAGPTSLSTLCSARRAINPEALGWGQVNLDFGGDAGNSVNKNAYDHFAGKHGTDFPGVQNAKQYVEEATRFINRPPKGTQTIIRNNGDIYFFTLRAILSPLQPKAAFQKL